MIDVVQVVAGGIFVGATYALVALGLYLVFRVTGVINLAQGGFCVFGALTAYALQAGLGLGAFGASLGAVAITALLGLAFAWLAFVPGLSRLSNGNMLMLSVGLLTMIEGILLVGWGSQPFILAPFSGNAPLAFQGVLVPTQGLWVLGTALVVSVAAWFLLARTPAGRAFRACAENVVAARLVGVDVRLMTLLAFALAAAVGALAGVVVAPTTTLQFDTGRLFTVSGFIAVVIGGLGSFSGAIVGAMLLGVVTQLATAYVSSLFSSAIALLLLMAVLVLKPSGLLGAGSSRRQDVRDEARVAVHIVRLPRLTRWIGGGLVLALALALPGVVTSPGIMSGLVIAAILFIALIGLDVVMGYAGLVNLGQAGFMAVGGYTAGYLVVNTAVEPVVAILAALLAGLACSLVLSAVTMRLRGLYLALATLAFGLLVDSAAIGFVDITGGPSGLVGIPPLSVGPFDFGTPVAMYYLAVAIDTVLLVTLGAAMRGSFGRSLIAIRTDPLAAAALGINVPAAKIAALAISAALGALSGALYAFQFNFLSPDMVGTPRSLELVAMTVIGGEGTLFGPLFGSVLLTLLPTLFQPLAIYKTLASGLLMVVSFLHLPRGLFGAVASVMTPVRRPPSPSSTVASKATVL